jgi:hypothetical protein
MSRSFIQTNQHTIVVSPLTGNKLYRNDSDNSYLLSPEFDISKAASICNRIANQWASADWWRIVVGTEFETPSAALIGLGSVEEFIGCFNDLIHVLNAQGSRGAKILMNTGLRRRFVELTSALWEAELLAAPPELPFHRLALDFRTLDLSRKSTWIHEISDVSKSVDEVLRRHAAYGTWRLAMTAIGVREAGDVTPEAVRKEAIDRARGQAIRTIRPLLAVQRRMYGAKLKITEHDWGVGRGKPRPVSDFSSVLQSDPSLGEWQALLSGWMANDVTGGVAPKRDALTVFFRYLLACPVVTRNPLEYVSRNYVIPLGYEEWIDEQALEAGTATKRIGQMAGFFDWYVDVRLALEDDLGRPVRNPQLFNPITRRKEVPKRAETAREALPIRYIRELIHIISHDEYAWAKSFNEDHIRRFHPMTKQWETVWSPVRAYAMLLKLYLPLRTYQVAMLDSGEADSFVYSDGQWESNQGELAPSGRALVQRGFLRRYQDANTRTEFTGFYINTNKTADRFKDLNDKGYEIPWQHDEVIRLAGELLVWQRTFNPIHQTTKWTELTNPNVTRSHTKAQLIARGASCFLFRDPLRSSKDHPIYVGRLQKFWHKLLDELERRVAARGETLPNGQPIRFIERRDARGNPMVPMFDLHSLRVSILTALSVEGGVPLSVLSKCVAGHASVLMTLYYLKQGPSYISQQLAEAQTKMLEREQENYLRFLQDCDLSNAESIVAFNDQAGLRAVQEHSAAGWIVGDLGICPVGGSRCEVGGPKLTGENGRSDYQPTPGGPRNCVRCRFFLSGPAFLGGLVAHFNSVGIGVVDASEQLRKMQTDITAAENAIFADTAEEATSSAYRRLDALYSRRETAMTELDVLANNWHATYTMIERSKAILATAPDGASPGKAIRLLATVDLADVATALGECRPFDLYNGVCQHATVYPATTVPTATLRRGRLLDAMLARNHREPVFASLTDAEALAVGNELVNFLYARLGRYETSRLIEGSRLLTASGLAEDMDAMLTERIGAPVKLSTLIYQESAPERDAQLTLEGSSV